mgnify:FL=1
MLKIKKFDGITIKIAMGLFFSVIIYYVNNFFFVMGNTERIPLMVSVFAPLLGLSIINLLMINNINEK